MYKILIQIYLNYVLHILSDDNKGKSFKLSSKMKQKN